MATIPADVLGLPKPAWAADDVAMLYDMAHRFMSEEILPHYDGYEKNEIVDRAAWEKAGAAGLLCASIPEEYGGSGGTFAHESAIIEAIGHVGVDGFGIALHNAIVAPYILHYGSEEQKKKWLPKMATGELIGAIAMTEPGAGSDLQGVKTRAEKDGNQYRINGSKTFITNGQLANLVIVVTKTDPSKGAKGTSLIVVETDEVDGFERGRNLDKIGLKANDTSELFFNDVRVPTSNLLGQEEGQGFVQLMQQLPQERLEIGTGAIAMIERALAVTIDYVKDRKAFGKAILDFQNTQFKLAELKTEATIGRVFYNDCVARHISGGLDPVTASMAKYWLSDLQCKIVDECLQLFGGYGYMNEYPIARMYRDARVQRIYGGTNEIMKLLIARSL
ncbi:acyl-CoA dehydrogenase family protein [Aminobacter sp. NyZ550]|uniref:Acyl-[acyl-carrier-protein] dehydrogenase MbtN n=2 Tax=Aminobacter TaxID=31988 RepID=A0AAC8YTJ5_AMIAI|nr:MULTISPECIES: acyl-CoA dehydrogenase family protein [Aminobacter]AMS44232.1 acyl-CoA dehydrogenase [Aminobacter aminovorans]MBA8910401.1 acyl-CoA dehydrogenase [Aminobacter ciceronei]MBA9024148.1 acyl-CoA dehydrogenase [Aminobacter ciceronei]MBB3709535.1 acyl-CoA dehydrogenase [Aminobacter aminovorans]MRX37005.1 acyl-CoA dehydrogenase [Aminobacter sp. MDW-2]